MGEMIFVIFHLADSFSPKITFFFQDDKKTDYRYWKTDK